MLRTIVEILLIPVMLVLSLPLILFYGIKGLLSSLVPTFLLPKKDVSGEIVLVTGGGCGFGRLFSLEFAKRGATVVIWDIDQIGADKVVSECKRLGGKASAYKVDVSKSEDVYRAAEHVKRDVGDVTILVNNAGVVAGVPLLEMPDKLINRTIDINTKAFFWTFKAFAPSILEKNHGHFVSVASIAGYFGGPRMTEYCASKFAVVGFEESMFAEFELYDKPDVHSTIIHPFFMNTGMFQGVEKSKGLLPVLKPEEVMSQCMAAILTNQRYVFIPGFTRLTIFFKSFMPADFQRFLSNSMNMDSYMTGFTGRAKQS